MITETYAPAVHQQMTDQELQEQFRLCEGWQDGDQWELLGLEYYRRGYGMNAAYCFRRADEYFAG